MIRSFRFASTAVLVIAPFAYLACSSSSTDDNTTNTTPDASADATKSPVDGGGSAIDGNSILFGDANEPQVDANGPLDAGTVPPIDADHAPDSNTPIDAGIDANPATGTATITTLDSNGAVLTGISVVVHDSTGAVVTTLVSNDAGVASGTVTGGDMITAVYGTATASRLFTIEGVEPGDSLTTRDTQVLPEGTFYPATLTLATAPTGTKTFRIEYGACNSSSNVITLTLNTELSPECLKTTTTSILVVATDANGNELGYCYANNVQLLAPPATTPVTMSAWETGIAETLNTTAIPAKYTADGVELATQEVGGPNPAWNGLTVTDVDGGMETSATFAHTMAGAFQQNAAALYDEFLNETQMSTQAIVIRSENPTAAATVNFDFTTLLPEITLAQFTTSGTAPVVGWTSASPLTSASGIAVQIAWSETGVTGAKGMWTLFVPSTATSVGLPTLPATFATYAPSGAVTYQTPPVVAAMAGTTAPTYTALRAAAATLSPTNALVYGDFGQPGPVLPVDGTLILSAYTTDTD